MRTKLVQCVQALQALHAQHGKEHDVNLTTLDHLRLQLLVADEELAASQALLQKFKEKGTLPAGTTDEQMWEAQKTVNAIIHPTTGEKMFLPGRMSAFVPANTIPTAGMLLAKTPAQTVFWQWINRTCSHWSDSALLLCIADDAAA